MLPLVIHKLSQAVIVRVESENTARSRVNLCMLEFIPRLTDMGETYFTSPLVICQVSVPKRNETRGHHIQQTSRVLFPSNYFTTYRIERGAVVKTYTMGYNTNARLDFEDRLSS